MYTGKIFSATKCIFHFFSGDRLPTADNILQDKYHRQRPYFGLQEVSKCGNPLKNRECQNLHKYI